jgi:hypothetical protein
MGIASYPQGRKIPRVDAAVPADAQTAPTGTWKTAQTAVSHTHDFWVGREEKKGRKPQSRFTHKNPHTPVKQGTRDITSHLIENMAE